MYKIKQIPEDFIVKEISNVKVGEDGDYSYYILKKKNCGTIQAVEKLADKLGIDKKFIGFAGNKDKTAVTEQIISIKKCKVKQMKLTELEIVFLGKGGCRINLGDLEGNRFIITVRNMEHKKRLEKKNIINYFDSQRFGKENNNHLVGKAIIKKEFKKALELLGIPDVGNPIKKIREINKKLLKLYIHSYQSYLWNKAVEEVVKQNIKVGKVPLVSFDTEFENEKLKKIYSDLLKKEGITQRDFIIRELPNMTPVTAERDVFLKIKNFSYKYEKEELNSNKLKCVLEFELPKGSYATLVVKSFFS